MAQGGFKLIELIELIKLTSLSSQLGHLVNWSTWSLLCCARVISCLLKNEPASFRIAALLKQLCCGGVAKASLNKAIFAAFGRPETRRSIHEQGEIHRKMEGGPNSSELQFCEMTCG
jgi:hypothetical protein